MFLSSKAVGAGLHPVFCALKIAEAPFNPIGLASRLQVLYYISHRVVMKPLFFFSIFHSIFMSWWPFLLPSLGFVRGPFI